MGKKALIFLVLFTLSSLLFSSKQDDWDFAESLFSRGMYDLALKEYLNYEKNYAKDKEKLSLLKFREGECFFHLGNLNKAEKKFKEVISYGKDKREESLYRISEIYIKEGNYKKAEKNLLALKKENIPEKLKEGVISLLGEVMIQEGKGREAENLFKEMEKDFPESKLLPYLWFNLGNFYYKRGEKKLAKEFLIHLLSFPTPIKDEVIYSLGKISLELKEYQESRKYFSLLLKEFPKSSEAFSSFLGMGISYYKESNFKEAGKWFYDLEKRKLKDKKIKESLWLWLGKLNFKRGNLKESSHYLSLIPQNSPFYSESQYFLAHVKKDEGKIVEAEKILENIFRSRSEYAPLSLLLLSEIYREEGKLKKALSYFSNIEVFKKSTYYPELLYNKGLILEDLSRYKESLEMFSSFISLFPSHKYYISSLFHKGFSLFHLGNYSKAEKYFQEAKNAKGELKEVSSYYLIQTALREKKIKLFFKRTEEFLNSFPKSSFREEVLYQSGVIAKNNGKLSLAVNYFQLYLKEFPENEYSPQVYYLLANTYFLMKEKENSAKTFLLLLKKFPDYMVDKKTFFYLAEYFVKNKEYKNAFFVYGRIQEKFPDEKVKERAEVGKGEVEILSGSIDKGIDRLEKFLKKHPTSPYIEEAFYFLGKAYYYKGKSKEAVKYWEKSTEGGKFAPDSLYSLGEYYFSKNSYSQSYRYYLKLSYLYQDFPLLPSALYKAGISLKRLGKEEEARKIFQEILTRFPQSKEAKKLRTKN